MLKSHFYHVTASSLGLIFFLSHAAFAIPSGKDRIWLTPDFFIQIVTPTSRPLDFFPNTAPPLEETDCRATIPQKMCLVAESRDGSPEHICLSGGEEYAVSFQRLYDEFPPALRGVFCELNEIRIDDQLRASAYGGTLRGPDGEYLGAVIGVRKSILDEGLSLSRWASWKEQLPFGGDPGKVDVQPDLPHIETATPGVRNDGLYFLIAHEFGHILDFKHGVNRICVGPQCEADGWAKISWLNFKDSKFDSVFPLRRRLVFYEAEERMSRNEVFSTYEQLLDTDFISLYAATNPFDDFAEMFAFYAMSLREGSYLLHTNSPDRARVLNYRKRYASVAFQAKTNYLMSFLDSIQADKTLKGHDDYALLSAPAQEFFENGLPNSDHIRWD